MRDEEDKEEDQMQDRDEDNSQLGVDMGPFGRNLHG